MATAAKARKGGFYIEVTCPGCGSALELESDFFVLRCDHCGSVHRVIMPDLPAAYMIPSRITAAEARVSVDRYLKEKSLPLTGSGIHFKQLYYPYWKIDAILFRLRNKVYQKVISEENRYQEAQVINQEKTEINLSPYTTTRAAGVPFQGVPVSIGMRAEYIKLVPFADANVEEVSDTFPVLTSWESVRQSLLENISLIAGINPAATGSNVTELFHPRASLIYFPFLVMESYSRQGFSRYIVDSVSGRVLDHITDIDAENQFTLPDVPAMEFGGLKVEHHRCSNCGVDLPSEQSYVYICQNCEVLTVLGWESGSLGELQVAVGSNSEQDKMFPFWSLKIPEAQAAQLRRLFGGIYRSDRLVIPAFKTRNFDAMFRLAKRISAAFPQLEIEPINRLGSRFLPVNVGPDEAILLTEVLIFRAEIERIKTARPSPAPLIPEQIELVYIPFHPEHYFYVDSALNVVTFEKKLAP